MYVCWINYIFVSLLHLLEWFYQLFDLSSITCSLSTNISYTTSPHYLLVVARQEITVMMTVTGQTPL